MLAAIKGLSRHKRVPPTSGKASVRHDDKGRVGAGRGAPHLFHVPLDRRSAWRSSEGVGTGNVCRAGQFAAPLPGASNREQKLIELIVVKLSLLPEFWREV